MDKFNCIFDYMKDDELLATVEIKNFHVKTTKYTDFIPDLPFGAASDNRVTIGMIDRFFEYHCFPKYKADFDEQLEMLGLEEFDAFEICRLTQGRMAGTQKWIRFHDDTRLLRMTEDGDLYDANNLTKREDEDYEYLFKDMRSRVKSV